MSVSSFLALIGAMTVWIGSAAGDQAAGAARQSPTTKAGNLESPGQVDDAKVYITAEDVLKALRSRRPTHPIIEPASARGRTAPIKRALWPEGASLVDQTGWLEEEGAWWVFHAESNEEIPPVKLLPNAALEGMVRTARGAAEPIYFQVSGEFTVFQDENYLLPRFAARLRRKESLPEPGVVEAIKSAEPEAGDASSAPSKPTVATDAPVDDVLRVLGNRVPQRRLISLNDRASTGRVEKRGLLPDGSPLVERPGRLTSSSDGWVFVFESDRLDYPEPPMALLLNMNTQLMVEAVAKDATGLVFLVSGEVTSFSGRNYLLPRIAQRRIDSGNLSK